MTRRREKPSRPGGRWLLVPAACRAWPLPVAGLATASALAWAGLGLALSIPLAAAMLLKVALAHVFGGPPGVVARADGGRNDHAV